MLSFIMNGTHCDSQIRCRENTQKKYRPDWRYQPSLWAMVRLHNRTTTTTMSARSMVMILYGQSSLCNHFTGKLMDLGDISKMQSSIFFNFLIFMSISSRLILSCNSIRLIILLLLSFSGEAKRRNSPTYSLPHPPHDGITSWASPQWHKLAFYFCFSGPACYCSTNICTRAVITKIMIMTYRGWRGIHCHPAFIRERLVCAYSSPNDGIRRQAIRMSNEDTTSSKTTPPRQAK